MMTDKAQACVSICLVTAIVLFTCACICVYKAFDLPAFLEHSNSVNPMFAYLLASHGVLLVISLLFVLGALGSTDIR